MSTPPPFEMLLLNHRLTKISYVLLFLIIKILTFMRRNIITSIKNQHQSNKFKFTGKS